MKRNLQFLLAFAFTLTSLSAFAQATGIQNFSTVQGANDERASGLAVGPSGGVYQVGRTESSPVNNCSSTTLSLPVGVTQAGFLSFFNATTCDLLTITNASANDVAVDSNGDVYVVGQILGSSDVNPGGGFSNTPPGASNAFIWKLDSNRNTLWVKTLPAASNEASADRIEIDDNHNIYVVGDFTGSINLDINNDSGGLLPDLNAQSNNDLFLVKLDSSGSYQWHQQVFTDGEIFALGSDLSVAAGRIAFGGFHNSNTLDFGPGGNIGNFTLAARKFYAAVFDTDGNYISSFSMERASSASEVVCQGIALDDNDSSLVVSGFTSQGGVDIVGTGQTLDNNGGFVVKFNADGSFAWKNELPSSSLRVFDVDTDTESNVYFSCWTNGAISIGQDAFGNSVNFTAVGNSIVGTGSRKAGLGMYDKFGRPSWAHIIGDNGNLRASALEVVDTGQIAICGEYNSPFDAYQQTQTNLLHNGGIDVFTFLMDTDFPCLGPGTTKAMPDTFICSGTAYSFDPELEFTDGNTTYQWYELQTDSAVTGQTNASFNLSNPTDNNEGFYYLVATNACGSVTFKFQDTLSIGVIDAPEITIADTVSGCDGSSAGGLRPSVVVSGATTYEWFKDGTSLGTQTQPIYAINPYTAADAGQYVLTVTDACGTTSDTLELVTQNTPYITQDFPATYELCPGTIGEILTTVGSVDTLTFNIIFNGALNNTFTGQLGSQYGLTLDGSVPQIFGSTLYLEFIGACAAATTTTTTVVQGSADPIINTQPADSTVTPGNAATFSVEASGPNLTYQWFKDGVALADGGNISGATTETLSVTNIAAADTGDYTVEVTGGCDTTTVSSSSAKLAITITARAALADAGVRVYPNPTEGDLFVTLENTTAAGLHIQLLDITGRPVQQWSNLQPSGNRLRLPLPGVASGMYILEVHREGWSARQRIIVR